MRLTAKLPERARLRGARLLDGTRAKVLTALGTTTVLAAAGLAAWGGGGEDGEAGGEPVGVAKVASTLGPGEGVLNLVTLPGYIENGGTDPRVDWVTPFEERTGCKIGWKVVKTPRQMADLMRDGSRRYDGVAAPPEVAGQLIAEDQVVPVNTDLVDGYKKLEPTLRDLLERDGKYYGVPYVWGSNLLVHDSRSVPPPSSWAALFDPEQARRYSEKLVMRDSPLSIAQAALYLKGAQPELGVEDPFSLTPEQLAAAGRVLKEQRPHVAEYWELPADAVSAFAAGDAVLGQAWPYHVDVLNRASQPIRGAVPAEGVTGWTDAWMISSRVQHPNCMYQWLQWTASADVQQQVAEWIGVAPANPQACSGDRLRPGFCSAYRVGDRDYLEDVVFAHTPRKDCGRKPGEEPDESDADEPGKAGCTSYAEWTRTWIESTKL